MTELRIKRGKKVIGFKIGSVQKQTQKKLWVHNLMKVFDKNVS